ncbi:MAG: GNAT family N-acetyltransferase [Asgard group archaeon]|nr:GNAT family N-acetyltransferase [Asgard group archaeon]
MRTEYEQFLQLARENSGYFCFMVWDYFKFPEFFNLKISNDTLRCNYEHYVLFHGKPDKIILEGFQPKGELVISFKPEWISLVKDYFYDFELVVEVNEKDKFNKFLCMELLEENFNPKEQYQSRKLTREDLGVLTIKRRIHQSRGIGGVGIIKNDSLLGCAFASQIVQEEPFSFASIRDVWVHPNYRNQGLGADLTSHISKIAFEQKIERIFLWVEERNYPAVLLYEKLGFTTVDSVLSAVCKVKKKS